MIRNTLFYIKEAFLSTKKNSVISLATVICLTATLIIVGIFLAISLNIDLFITNIESQLTAIAYFKDNLPEAENKEVVNEISALKGVKEVHYISKEEALQKLREDLAEHEDILAGCLRIPLPSSLELKFMKRYLEEIANLIGQYKG